MHASRGHGCNEFLFRKGGELERIPSGKNREGIPKDPEL
jgi:hypothetical protein